ncbi:MAG: prepilin-type N-terminal cleavage/methylation domain-containing protein [Candidatus Liptonbacteria bacterium]|nr:prepilin-type N-terminal cleavage/methylation domain-containing protein [Candidatus Liptonbacteria bacterium]
MKLPKTSNGKYEKNVGFTLIEILVTLGISSVLIAVGLFVTLDAYRVNSINSERDLMVSILEKARAKALANLYESPHGVRVDADSYVIFRGPTYSAYDPTNETIPRGSGIIVTAPADFVFEQLTGNSSVSDVISLSDGARIEIISVNSEGRINW